MQKGINSFRLSLHKWTASADETCCLKVLALKTKWRPREPPSLFERPTGYYGATESYFVPCVGIRRSPGCPVNSHRSSLGPSAQRFADSAPAHSPSNMPQVRQWLGRESEPRVPGHRKIGGVPRCFQGEIRAVLPHIRVNGYWRGP